ncbi:Alpha/Beta hydrolase protein [Dactylonectria macrodidyma]|uniref:Alpha/Beta hydrolase protein n=1 Tax=Dactylonectria macrodidyma TaxID=307937 RepID=A0A9P9EMT4_9HYPO|nr:Alpha/Beta hydrolase protein [Dactylonectria macrodidyma]
MTPPFSNAEKFLLVARQVCFVLWYIPVALLHSSLVAWDRGLPLRLFLICGVFNVVLAVLRPREIQFLCTSTQETYRAWMRRNTSKKEIAGAFPSQLSLDIEPLGGGASLLWVGDRRTAKKVVLFFHGGGFITPLLPGHMEICWRACVGAGTESGTEVAVAILEYTLYPAATYPTQLRQASSGLSHLLSSGFLPQDIIIGGDSAGGKLTAQLLCHVVRSHPELVPIHLDSPLAATFLISPWLSRYTDDQSYAENGSIDMISSKSVGEMVRRLCGDPHEMKSEKSELASRAFPLDMEVPCFEGLGVATRQMYVTVGYHEVFREQCMSYVRQVRRFNPEMKVQFDVQEKFAHDFLLLEGLEERSGECMLAMKEWMKSLLMEDV